MGILSSLIARALKASPFQSESLDKLADLMHVNEFLKKSNLKRYYRVRSLQAGCLAYIDRVFFDAKYLEMLLPGELLAVGAHEFTHVKGKHGAKRFYRIFGPALAVVGLMGCFVFVSFESIGSILFFSNLGKVLSSFFVSALSFLPALIAFFFVNAKWSRQREIECDLSSVKFADGEAMISALNKLSKLRPRKMSRLESRFLPRTYPTLEERINNIRMAMNNKENQSGS